MKNFWDKLEKPIVGLAPMDGVTDAPMRYITTKYGAPDVIITEFVSADGLVKAKDKSKLLKMLEFDERQRPIVAQLFGSEPAMFYEASKMVVELGFDGIDINMGCPAKNVAQRGAGAGLIKTPELAGQVIASVKRGVKNKIPVSVKTRIGYEKVDLKWIEFLSKQKIACLTVHGRTFKQGYAGKADWKALCEAAKIVKRSQMVFFGNGDVRNREDGERKCKKYGVDGVLIGRAAIGNPEIFKVKVISNKEKRLKIAIEHAKKFEEIFPEAPFFAMRKHLATYATGFDGAKKVRIQLMKAESAADVEQALTALVD